MTTTTFRCDCVPHGESSPHSSEAQCRANRAATGVYLKAISTPPSLPDVRDADGKFVRFAEEAECALPHGSLVEGGTLRKWH